MKALILAALLIPAIPLMFAFYLFAEDVDRDSEEWDEGDPE